MKRLLPSSLTLLTGGLFLATAGMGPRLFSLDGDLGRHLTIGRYILTSGQIPLRDLFSHTMSGQPLVPHEWLAQVIFALGEGRLGLGWPVWVTALVIAATFGIAALDANRRAPRAAPFFTTLITLLLASVSTVHWLARPHIFTLLLTALWASHLETIWRQNARAPKDLALTALLMLLWVNLHGAFIVGFVVGGAYLGEALLTRARERSRRLFVHAGVAFGITFLNPAGWRVWDVVYRFLSNRYLVAHTQEYQPPNFQQAGFWPFLVFLGALLLLSARRQKTLPWRYALLLSGWAVLSLYSARNIPILAVLAVPILAEGWQPLPTWWQKREEALQAIGAGLRFQPGWTLGVLLLAFLGLSSAPARAWLQHPPTRFPVAATNQVLTHPPAGKMFNYFDWGGYLLYRLWPERRVFIDGQTDFYGEALTREYARIITAAAGWETTLARYNVQWVIIPPDVPLAAALSRSPAWTLTWEDETALIFVQRTQPGE